MIDAAILSLVGAVVFFVGWHFGVSSTRLRAVLVDRFGEKGFAGLFSLVSLAGLVWIIVAYRAAPVIWLWGRPEWAVWLVIVAMPVALTMIFGVGPKNTLGPMSPVTRHPMFWGMVLWASVHIAANGDVASIILFGGMGLLALLGTFAIDAKTRRRDPDGWASLVATTSNLPLVALIDGRTTLSAKALAKPFALAMGAYVVITLLHHFVFGLKLPIYGG
jgi:uncharacterized membrane protein